jgi:diphosphoinositol-polyphosphate diphosphatase
MHPSLPMSARTGRTTARYTPGTNRRLCAGVVALSTHTTPDSPGHHTHVLVTSSSRHPDRFVLPKGGWEQDETAEQSALREGWEEGNFALPRPKMGRC